MKYVVLSIIILGILSCKETASGRVEDAIEKMKFCYYALKKDDISNRDRCFDNELPENKIDKYIKITREITDKQINNIYVKYPAKDKQTVSASRVKAQAGGASIGLIYKDKSWYITSVFWK